MGLISAILTAPLAPVRGVVWVAEQVPDRREDELLERLIEANRGDYPHG